MGKTSTKDAVFAVVEKKLVARKSQKSFNSELGLPLTILGCDNAWSNPFRWLQNIVRGVLLVLIPEHYPKWLVLEIGVNKPGDIKRAMGWLSPDVVIMTRFGSVPVHVEFFASPDELFEEKTHLVKALKPEGVLILNTDDEKVYALKEKTKAHVISYGFAEHAMFRGSNVTIEYRDKFPVGTAFKLEYNGNVFPVMIPGVLGVQAVYSVLPALALGVYLKQNVVDMVNDLAEYKSPPGRMRVMPGVKNSIIIDDSYNSSPIAALAALDVLRDVKTKGKKIAVLGDMLELGKFTVDEHRKLGAYAGTIADYVFAVGPRAKDIAEGAVASDLSEKNIIEFDDARVAGKYLEQMIHAGDVALIKGSQSMRMERAVEEVMAEPENAATLLARQESEWKAKI